MILIPLSCFSLQISCEHMKAEKYSFSRCADLDTMSTEVTGRISASKLRHTFERGIAMQPPEMLTSGSLRVNTTKQKSKIP